MGYVITAQTNKGGGSTKTTSIINMAYEMAGLGFKVIVIGVNFSQEGAPGYFINSTNKPYDNRYTNINYLLKRARRQVDDDLTDMALPQFIDSAIFHSQYKNIDFMPSSLVPPSFSAEIFNEALTVPKYIKVLKTITDVLKQKYEMVFIDCGPGLPSQDPLILNTMVAADFYYAPISLDSDQSEIVKNTMRLINETDDLDRQLDSVVNKGHESVAKLLGILETCRSVRGNTVAQDTRRAINQWNSKPYDILYNTYIHGQQYVSRGGMIPAREIPKSYRYGIKYKVEDEYHEAAEETLLRMRDLKSLSR